MKNKLYIMCGAPGAGKTTWIKNNMDYFSGIIKIISRDMIRFSLVKEDEAYFSKEKTVYKIFIEEIAEGLHNANTVIVDATHLNQASRLKLFNSIHKEYNPNEWEVNMVVVDTCLAECLRQNEMREGTRSYVPTDALRNMFNSFVMPNFEDEPYIDKIIIYRANSKIKYNVMEKE